MRRNEHYSNEVRR